MCRVVRFQAPLVAAVLVCSGLQFPSVATAQRAERQLMTAPAQATVEERTSQDDFWVLEVTYKPVRMVTVDVTDPKTGETKRETIWYLVYKAVRPPLEQRNLGAEQPVNELDPPLVAPPRFVPQFELVTEDEGRQQIYLDQIIPEAQAAINRRERGAYKNSVEIVGPIPEESTADEEKALYGVAMWRGVDPETDRFTIYMTGFSNGYKIVPGPDGNNIVLRKTLVQKYWRPGDEFNAREREVRHDGDPQWIYR